MTQDNTTDILQFNDSPKPKLPSGLNVLTILTFIGCAWELYSNVKNFLGGKKALEEFEKAQDQLAEAPAWVKKLAGPEVHEVMVQGLDNRVPIIIIGMIGTILCFYGALQMRKLKKEGYILWLVGEMLPILGTIIFLPVFFKTIFVYFLIIPIIFIILYTTQRKHLVH